MHELDRHTTIQTISECTATKCCWGSMFAYLLQDQHNYLLTDLNLSFSFHLQPLCGCNTNNIAYIIILHVKVFISDFASRLVLFYSVSINSAHASKITVLTTIRLIFFLQVPCNHESQYQMGIGSRSRNASGPETRQSTPLCRFRGRVTVQRFNGHVVRVNNRYWLHMMAKERYFFQDTSLSIFDWL